MFKTKLPFTYGIVFKRWKWYVRVLHRRDRTLIGTDWQLTWLRISKAKRQIKRYTIKTDLCNPTEVPGSILSEYILQLLYLIIIIINKSLPSHSRTSEKRTQLLLLPFSVFFFSFCYGLNCIKRESERLYLYIFFACGFYFIR